MLDYFKAIKVKRENLKVLKKTKINKTCSQPQGEGHTSWSVCIIAVDRKNTVSHPPPSSFDGHGSDCWAFCGHPDDIHCSPEWNTVEP